MAGDSLKISSPKDSRKQNRNADNVRNHRARQRDCQYGPPQSLSRRRRLEKKPEKWLRYYLAESFPLPFCKFHKEYLEDLQYIMRYGGWKATALPRGSGKTTIAKGFALLSLLTGKSPYLFLISATATEAKQNLESIKSWLQFNDKLAADYPEVCEPIRFTRGVPQAMKSITANGINVEMAWTDKHVMLPGLPIAKKSGKTEEAPGKYALLQCGGITGSIRGATAVIPTGFTIRPHMVIVDDPQTPATARSAQQCRYRLDLIRSDIANLGGPGQDARLIVPCTIIENGDLADDLTDFEKMPDFLGQRHPFFLSMPKNMKAWEKYNEVRVDGLDKRDKGKGAEEYYIKNRAKLTEGAEVIWPERDGSGAVDGIQWGMNQYFKLGAKSFATEMQNQPIPPEELIHLTKEHVEACETKTPQWVIPFNHLHTCAFIDCNPRSSGLHWAVVAFGEKLAAQVISYGRYPSRGVLVPEGASDTEEASLLFEGLRVVCGGLRDHELKMFDGTPAKIDLVMVDAGYQWATVQQFVQGGKFPFQLVASRGRSATKYSSVGRDVIKAMSHVHLRRNPKGERYLSHNACVLREIAHRAFIAGPDAPGGIGIHAAPPAHGEFAEQVTAKTLTDKAEGDKGWMYKWSLKPGGQDHWLDCIVGAYAGAHWFGVESSGEYSQRKQSTRKRKRGLRKVSV